MKIRVKTYKEDDIKVKVPFDGETYINATEVYQAFGKSKSGFDSWKTRTLIPYAERLLKLGKIPSPQNADMADLQQLIVVRKGGSKLHETGTWLHPKLAIVFARWLSMEFEIWCDEKITELLEKGEVVLKDEDKEYVDITKKIFNHTGAKDREFITLIRQLLRTHETQGKNIKAFQDFMVELGKVAAAEDRLEAYSRVNKVIEELYQNGELDITTREKMKKLVQTSLDRLRTKRLTLAQKKIEALRQELGIKFDKEAHDELIRMSKEKQEAEAKADAIQTAHLGAAPTANDEGLDLFTLPAVAALNRADALSVITSVLSRGYKMLYQSHLVPKAPRSDGGPKLPAGTDELPVAGIGRVGVAVWDHDNCSFLRVTTYDANGQPYPRYEVTLEAISDGFVYRGVNNNKTLCALYHRPTRYLLVYYVPKQK